MFLIGVAALVMEHHWAVEDCVGAPYAMYVFRMKSYTATSASTNNETWPPNFSLFTKENPIGNCGRMNNELKPYQCCQSVIGTSSWPKMPRSVSFDELSATMSDNIPKSAIGASYCLITAATGSNLGYSSVYVLKDQCTEKFYCSENQLSIFSSASCTGTFTNYSLTPSLSINHNVFGYNTVSYTTIQSGTAMYIWSANVPKASLVADFSYAFDTIVLIVTIICLILFSLSTLYTAYKLYLKQTYAAAAVFVPQLLWLVNCLLNSILNYITVDSNTSVILKTTQHALSGFNSLLTIMSTVYIYLLSYPQKRWITISIYLFLVLLNVGASGTEYVYYWYSTDKKSWAYLNWSYWKPYATYWLIFMCIADATPIAAVLYKIIFQKQENGWMRFTTFIATDTTFFVILASYIITIIAFIVLTTFRTLSRVSVGNDRNEVDLGNFIQFPLSVHTFLQCYCLEHLIYLIQSNKLHSYIAGNSLKSKKGETIRKFSKRVANIVKRSSSAIRSTGTGQYDSNIDQTGKYSSGQDQEIPPPPHNSRADDLNLNDAEPGVPSEAPTGTQLHPLAEEEED